MLLPIRFYRKIRLSSYFRNQLADRSLITKLRSKFSNDAFFVMESWSVPNPRFHEPIRDVDFRKFPQKNGFSVLLIYELRTSKCCLRCEGMTLETF